MADKDNLRIVKVVELKARGCVIVGVALILCAVLLNGWVIVPGEDSVEKTQHKIKLKSNISAEEWIEHWHVHQATYDRMKMQKVMLFSAIHGLKRNLTIANNTLMNFMQAMSGVDSTTASSAILFTLDSITALPNAPNSLDSDSITSPTADWTAASPNAPGLLALQATMQILGEAIQAQSGNLRRVMVGMAKLEAMNASLTSLDEMGKQCLRAGFFGLCTLENRVEVCGALASFRNESMDAVCDPNYKSTSIPTKEDVLAKTRTCNANALAKTMLSSVGFFGGIIIGSVGLTAVISILLLVMQFKETPNMCITSHYLLGILLFILGLLPIVMTLVFQSKVIVNGFNKNGMRQTSLGIAGKLSIAGGCCVMLSGILLLLSKFLSSRKPVVAPEP